MNIDKTHSIIKPYQITVRLNNHFWLEAYSQCYIILAQPTLHSPFLAFLMYSTPSFTLIAITFFNCLIFVVLTALKLVFLRNVWIYLVIYSKYKKTCKNLAFYFL